MKTILFLLVAITTFAPTASAKGTKIYWGDIAVGATRFRPGGGWESSVGIAGAWTPIVDFRKFLVRGDIGISCPADRGGYRFLSLNAGAFLMVPVYSLLAIEGGGGLQYWKTGGGMTHPIVGGNVVLRVGETIDRVFFGYSRYLVPGGGVDQFTSGLAVNLF